MSKIRPANTTVLLLRRLADVENAAAPDVMELVGLVDEFQRVERKWIEQIAGHSERRQRGDPQKMDGWFEKLDRQIDRVLRNPPADPALPLLRTMSVKVKSRTPMQKSA